MVAKRSWEDVAAEARRINRQTKFRAYVSKRKGVVAREVVVQELRGDGLLPRTHELATARTVAEALRILRKYAPWRA